MNSLAKKIGAASAAAAFVVSLAVIDARYGKAGDVKQNKQAIQRINQERQVEWLQQRLWALEKEFGTQAARDRRDYKEIKAKVDLLLKKLGK